MKSIIAHSVAVMDDLSGLDWSNSIPSTNPPALAHPALRPTPSPSASGRSTPLSLQQSGRVLKAPSKPATPANDSFASLLGTTSAKTASNLSLQDRQKQLQQERARQQAEERKKLDAHFGSNTAPFWDGYEQNGSRSSSGVPSPTPAPAAAPNPLPHLNSRSPPPEASHDGEDDILAAFNASAPVDASSHFPPPHALDNGRNTPAQASKPVGLASTDDAYQFNDDDDPFGLNRLKPQATPPPPPAAPPADDDDVLGMLGKPVSELPRPKPRADPAVPSGRTQDEESEEPTDPRDKAVAELVDMGFPADKAATALARTENGTNVQAAVGILLNEAHEESRQKARGRRDGSQRADSRGAEPRRRPDGRTDDPVPSWIRQDGQDSSGSRQSSDRSEKALAQTASEMGASFLKGANTLWKAGQKRVQKAVADFQQDSDLSQPKWMRDAQLQEAASNGKAPQKDMTDEAMMLEGGGRPPKPPRPQKTSAQPSFHDEAPRRPSPAQKEPSLPPKPQERSAVRMTRQDLEAQTPEFYVSPARRRGKPNTTSPAATPQSEPPSRPTTRSPFRPSSPPLQSKNPIATPFQPQPQTPQPKPSAQPPSKPQRPPRKIPPTSPSAISTSHTHRLAGTASFKRGDYAAAHASYTAALAPLHPTHPLSTLLHTNRALTALKIGDPKAAISDADSALAVIGVGKGEGERIELDGDGGSREMKEVWGKAVVRKAEALESLERYGEAVGLWRVAIEAGVGGVAGVRGRERCERALGERRGGERGGGRMGKVAARRPVVRQKGNAVAELGGAEPEAVQRMREANRAAERADDEKFALTDAVDAKLVAWKGTKSDNLRALLGSLDKLLWPEAGYAISFHFHVFLFVALVAIA